MGTMKDALRHEEEAFQRAFEAAQALDHDPEAWIKLRQAVEELVRLGAVLPEEAGRFEALLTTSRGRITLHEPML